MRHSFYRALIAILAGWVLLSIPSALAVAHAAIRAGDVRAHRILFGTIGLGLLPVSVVGLWHLRGWGFICIILGFILVAATIPSAIYLHATCIGITILRYCRPQSDATKALEKA